MPLTIREQSDQMKAAAAEKLPADVVEVFDQSVRDLLDEGVPADTIKVGDHLESFTLDDASGAPVSLDQILEAGPAVIVFYRGGWCPYCNLALRTYQDELLASSTHSIRGLSPSVPSLPTSPSRLPRRQPSSSPSSPTRAVDWHSGSASRSSRRMMSSPPSASSASTWPR